MDLLRQLIDDQARTYPSDLLYHYTSLFAAESILRTGRLWATEAAYLNDHSEILNFLNLLRAASLSEAKYGDLEKRTIAEQLAEWLKDRSSGRPKVFVTSFSERGNLLSQWRAYCPYGQGVSLGFKGEITPTLKAPYSLQLVRCRYDEPRDRYELAVNLVREVISIAADYGAVKTSPRVQSYYDAFGQYAGELFFVASFFKDKAFEEEREWRLVTSPVTDYRNPGIKFRPAKNALAPYIEVEFRKDYSVQRIIVGPTPQMSDSMESIGMMANSYGLKDVSGNGPEILNCNIPYRG